MQGRVLCYVDSTVCKYSSFKPFPRSAMCSLQALFTLDITISSYEGLRGKGPMTLFPKELLEQKVK